MITRRYSIAVVCVALLGAGCASSSSRPTAAVDAAPATDVTLSNRRQASCAAAMLMLDEGWWVRARTDGPSTIGYGALSQRISVEPGIVDATAVCALIVDHVRPWQAKGDSARDHHYFTVVFGSDNLVRDIAEEIYPQLYDLFRDAYRHRTAAEHPFPGDVDTIVRIWQGAFFLTSRS